MTVGQLWLILRGRWRLIAWATLAAGAIGIATALILPKKYTAYTALMVDLNSGDPTFSGESGSRGLQQTNQAVMATQADLLASPRVARKVVEALKLSEAPDFRAEWERSDGRESEIESFLATFLIERLDVKPSKDSSVLSVSYTDTQAQRAAAIANAFAQGMVDTSLELRVEPARQFARWFEERRATLRGQLESAQARLAAYQREKGLVVAPQGQIDIENAKLAQLTSQLLEIQATLSESHSRQAQTRDSTTSPDVVNSPVVASLRTSISTAESDLKTLNAKWGDRHPEVIAAREQVAALRAQLANEMRTVATSMSGANAVNLRREAEAKAAVAAQRERVLQLTQGSTELAVLTRDVEAAQKALEQASTAGSQSALQSQLQQTNVMVLSAASPPSRPSAPRTKLIAGGALLFGLMLGIGLALVREARRPLVRSLDDLASLVDVTLLAPVSHARRRGVVQRLLLRNATAQG